jgi:uncharacterized protein (DUF433 family)
MELPDFLTRDPNRQIVCTGHRIGLVDVVYFFNEGYSPEMIACQFPTLALALVYKVIGFYLENRTEVDRYVAQEQEQVARQREESPRDPEIAELRQRLAQMQHVKVS